MLKREKQESRLEFLSLSQIQVKNENVQEICESLQLRIYWNMGKLIGFSYFRFHSIKSYLWWKI